MLGKVSLALRLPSHPFHLEDTEVCQCLFPPLIRILASLPSFFTDPSSLEARRW